MAGSLTHGAYYSERRLERSILLFKLLYRLRSISHFDRVCQLLSRASRRFPRLKPRLAPHRLPSSAAIANRLKVHPPRARGLLLFPFQENLDLYFVCNKPDSGEGETAPTLTGTGPGVDRARERGDSPAARPRQQSRPGADPCAVPRRLGEMGPGPGAEGAGSVARSLQAPSRRGGGPQPPSAAGALTPSPALSLARGGSDGASGARCLPAWQLLPAQHMRSPVRARLSPGAAPFRGLRCYCRHRQAGGQAGAEPPGAGQPRSGGARPAPPRSLRNLVAPRPCAQPRGGGASAP